MVPANTVVLGIVSVSALSIYQRREMRKEKFLRFWSVTVLIYFIYLFGLESSLETYVFKKKKSKMWTNWLWEYMLSLWRSRWDIFKKSFQWVSISMTLEDLIICFLEHLNLTGTGEGNGRILIQSIKKCTKAYLNKFLWFGAVLNLLAYLLSGV